MVIVKLAGGLGNQLFQYSLGLYIKEKYKFNVFYDVSFYVSKKRLAHEKLNILEFSFIDINTINYIGYVSQLKVLKDIFHKFIIYDDSSNVNFSKDNRFYIGNWQTYIYADYVKHLLIKHLNLRSDNLIIKEVQRENTATFHIRGTDILLGGYGGLFKVLNEKYYLSALNSLNYIDKIVVVTDDRRYANSLNFGNTPVTIISNDNVLLDFNILSSAKNLVCANSTFSWWAAYVGNADKIIFPNDLNFTNKKNFIPYNWIILNI